MAKFTTVFLMIARTLGAILIILGACIWLGIAAKGITPVHAILGSLFVLDVWVVALIALFALPTRALPLLVLALGGVVLWFGMAQTTLLVGAGHWSVRLLHLLLGLAMLGLVESLGKAVRLRHPAAHTTS